MTRFWLVLAILDALGLVLVTIKFWNKSRRSSNYEEVKKRSKKGLDHIEIMHIYFST